MAKNTKKGQNWQYLSSCFYVNELRKTCRNFCIIEYNLLNFQIIFLPYSVIYFWDFFYFGLTKIWQPYSRLTGATRLTSATRLTGSTRLTGATRLTGTARVTGETKLTGASRLTDATR